ncbi:MAG: hypothetical protein GIW95_06545 [Candidatus Eremiobacteraeota bacterium]|nr:hypothetical protein [Candidatus Eremiobacteraeota bacterium]
MSALAIAVPLGTAAAPAPPATKAALATFYWLRATPHVVHAGDTVNWEARTSPDIVVVRGAVQVNRFFPNYEFAFVKGAPGHFTMSFSIPANMPPVFRGTYEVRVVATAENGKQIFRTLEMRVE